MRPFTRIGAALAAVTLCAGTAPAEPGSPAPATEFLCLKDLKASLEGLSIACYSEAGCAFVAQHKGEPLPDYDQESVPYALGREKIEGIVTSSAPIMRKIKEFGYSCQELGRNL